MKTITAVPESITREQYLSLMEAIGLEVQNVRTLEFKPDGIYADVYEVDAQGRKMVDTTEPGGQCIINRVYIPVVG